MNRRTLARMLVGATAAGGLMAAGTRGSPSASAADPETVLLRIAGDDVTTTTLAPQIATRLLSKYGATGIEETAAAPPYTKKLSGLDPRGQLLSILIRVSSTADGFSMLLKGADIATGVRPVTRAETQRLAPLGDMTSPDAFFRLAATPMTMVVDPSNRVSALSFEQVRAIFAGRLNNWADVGGTPGPITIYARAPGAGVVDLFNEFVMGPIAYSPHLRTFPQFDGLRQALRSDDQALSYLPVQAMDGFKLVRLRARNRLAAFPDEFSVRTGDYPFIMTLTLYRSPKTANGAVAEYLTEAASSQTEIDILEAGFAGLNRTLLVPDPQGKANDGDGAPPEYRDLVRHGLRISITIRFDSVPPNQRAKLDADATDDVNDLAAYLRTLGVPPAKVRYVAASNYTGDPRADIETSRQLGAIVVDALADRHVPPSNVMALGSAAPLTSDDLPAGRRLNRRVETWVLP